MASGLSETSIFNMVLDRLVEESVLGTSDNTAVTRWLNRNYPIQRDLLVQKHPWNFAVARALLAEDAARPVFEWGHQYDLPSDCLRVLPLTCDGMRDSRQVPFVVESGKILTNMPAPLRVRYLRRETNPARFTPMFANVLAQILAGACAHWLTGKASLAKLIQDQIPSLLADAQLIDSLEGTPEPPDDDDILRVR